MYVRCTRRDAAPVEGTGVLTFSQADHAAKFARIGPSLVVCQAARRGLPVHVYMTHVNSGILDYVQSGGKQRSGQPRGIGNGGHFA
jgi:hypothetical protein